MAMLKMLTDISRVHWKHLCELIMYHRPHNKSQETPQYILVELRSAFPWGEQAEKTSLHCIVLVHISHHQGRSPFPWIPSQITHLPQALVWALFSGAPRSRTSSFFCTYCSHPAWFRFYSWQFVFSL